jgi:hypothetical protein
MFFNTVQTLGLWRTFEPPPAAHLKPLRLTRHKEVLYVY